MRIKSVCVIIFFIISLLADTYAQTPQLLNYQGKLTNKDGAPTTGSYTMVFSIYREATGGTALWQESQRVTVLNGVFNVLLGSSKALTELEFTGHEKHYLGIQVENELEMVPRFLLTSVPYAFQAAIADSVKDAAITYRKQTITTYKAFDRTFKRHTGTGQTKISEFKFENVPAGDIFVILTCIAIIDPGASNAGSLSLEIGNENEIQCFPSYILESDRRTQITLHGSLHNFAGGQLIIRLSAMGDLAGTSFSFGVENDTRFARWVTVLAGL